MDRRDGIESGSDFPTLALENWLHELPPDEAAPVAGLTRETPLEILFTSGTTGDPKGIVLTHGNVRLSLHPGVTSEDVEGFLAALPGVVADLRAEAGVTGL